MSAKRLLYLAAAAALAAQPALSDQAKQRGGSGGSSSAAGSRHHSGSGSRPSGYSGSAGRSGSHGPSTLTGAQRRHPRAGTGSGWRYGYHGQYPYYPYHPYYGGYYYGYPYYGWGFGLGYYPYGGLYMNSWWWDAPYYGHGTYFYDAADAGSVRVLVDQPKARVYVDGYYAGIVDDFDGMFQRLRVAPGEHDITVKLEGYKTHNFSVLVPYDGTLKLRWELEPGEGHDGTGDPTLAPPRREARRERDEDRWTRREPQRSPRRDPEATRDGFATLRFDVRPDDASVYVDGAFRGAARELGSLELPAGQHRIEIVRPGYRTYEREVTVEEGGGAEVSVELEK